MNKELYKKLDKQDQILYQLEQQKANCTTNTPLLFLIWTAILGVLFCFNNEPTTGINFIIAGLIIFLVLHVLESVCEVIIKNKIDRNYEELIAKKIK